MKFLILIFGSLFLTLLKTKPSSDPVRSQPDRYRVLTVNPIAIGSQLSIPIDTLYFNSENKPTSKRKNAEHFKVVTKTDSGYVVEFLDKGQFLTQKTTFKDPELKIPHGTSEGYFGKVIGSKGMYVNGKEEGIWRFYHPDGQVSGIINYNNGKRISEEYINPDGSKETDPKKIEQLPSFPGGTKAMGVYFSKVLRYPPNARERGARGTVKIGFNISTNGKLEDIRVISGPDDELNNEALKLVRMMPPWIPAVQFNRPVKFAYVLPVFFQLSNQPN